MASTHVVNVRCDVCGCHLEKDDAARRVIVIIGVMSFDVCELCLETPLRVLVAKVDGKSARVTGGPSR